MWEVGCRWFYCVIGRGKLNVIYKYVVVKIIYIFDYDDYIVFFGEGWKIEVNISGVSIILVVFIWRVKLVILIWCCSKVVIIGFVVFKN